MTAIVNNHNKPRAFAIQLISRPSFFASIPDKALWLSQDLEQIEIGLFNFAGTYALVHAMIYQSKKEAIENIVKGMMEDLGPATYKKVGNTLTFCSRIEGVCQFLIKEVDSKYLKANNVSNRQQLQQTDYVYYPMRPFYNN